MKKCLSLFVIFFMLLNEVFATGVKPLLQSQKDLQSQIKIKEAPQIFPKLEKIQIPSANAPRDSLETAIERIQKMSEPLKISASTDVSIYKKISLTEAINYAICHNLDIRGNRLNIGVATNGIKAANRLQNPYGTVFYNLGVAATDNPNFFALMQTIELFKRGARKKLAQSNLELIKGNLLLAELNLRLDVRQAYVDLVAAKSILKILEEQRQLLQGLLNIAQRKYEVGIVPQIDVIHAKMTLNQLLVQLNSARTNVLIARFRLNMLLCSRDFDTKEDFLPTQKEFVDLLTPKPTENPPSFDVISDIAMSKRLDIKNARQAVDVAQKNLVVTVRKRIPDLEIGGGYMFVPDALTTANRTTQGACIFGNITNLPLFYQYTPEIKNAKIQLEQKELAYNSTINQALLNLHSAYDSFYTAQVNLNYYNDVLLLESNQFLNMAKKSYEAGKTNMVNFIYIEQSYRNIMMGYTNALANYYNSWVELLREVNDEGLKLDG